MAAKKGLLFGPKRMASSPFCAANCSSAMSRSSYVLEVFSRYLLRGHNYLNTAPHLGFAPLYILFLAMTSFTEGEMHVIDNQRKKIPKVTFMNRDI